jgi:hypothetical protein
MKFFTVAIISLASIAAAQPYSTPPADNATTTSDCSTSTTSSHPITTSDCSTYKCIKIPKPCPKDCDKGKPGEVCLVSKVIVIVRDRRG